MNVYRNYIGLIIIIFSFSNKIIFAQWVQTNGPYGGLVSCLCCVDSHLIAGANNAGVFISSDNGSNWIHVDNPFLANVLCFSVNKTTIYAGTVNNGVLYSTDYGSSWIKINNNGLTDNFIVSMVFKGDSTFIGTMSGHIFLSIDKGYTWTLIGSTKEQLYKLIVSGTKLYAGTWGGLYVSKDNGMNWQLTDIDSGDVKAIISYPNKYGQINVLTGIRNHCWYQPPSSLFVSNDNGISWSKAGLNLEIDALAISKNETDETIIYAAAGGTIYSAVDNGNKLIWNELGNLTQNISDIITSRNDVFALTSSGVFQSIDNGKNWILKNSGMMNGTIGGLVVDSSSIYTCNGPYTFSGSGISCSTDNGQSWKSISNGITNPQVSCITIANKIIIAGTMGDGIFTSTNKGQEWIQRNIGLDGIADKIVYALKVLGDKIFAGTNAGVFTSSNYGVNWIKAGNSGVDSSTAAFEIISDRNNKPLILAATPNASANKRGIWLTADEGNTWVQKNNGLSNLGILCFTHFTNNDGNNKIFCGTWGDGVFLSTNNGSIWEPVNNGLTEGHVNALLTIGNSILACTWSGVFVSSDTAASWIPMIDSLTTPCATSIVSLNGYIFIGTAGIAGPKGYGVWKRPLSQMITGIPANKISTYRKEFNLYQNYPNPFNPSTKIRFDIPKQSYVKLIVYDILGREVAVLVNKEMNPGSYEASFDGKELSSGVYLYRIEAEEFTATKKFVLIK